MEFAAAVRILRCKSFEKLILLTKSIRYEVAFKAVQLRVSKSNASDSMYHSEIIWARWTDFLHCWCWHTDWWATCHRLPIQYAKRRPVAAAERMRTRADQRHTFSSRENVEGEIQCCARSRGFCQLLLATAIWRPHTMGCVRVHTRRRCKHCINSLCWADTFGQ